MHFSDYFPLYVTLPDIEYSSFCCSITPCYVSTLHMSVCICSSHTPSPSLFASLLPLATMSFYSVSVSLCLFGA